MAPAHVHHKAPAVLEKAAAGTPAPTPYGGRHQARVGKWQSRQHEVLVFARSSRVTGTSGDAAVLGRNS